MRSGATEIEVKFHIARPQDLERRILGRGGQLIQPRTLETNLRYDTPDGRLRQEHRVLRLRRDAAVTLTYKGPGELADGIRSRTEIEVAVGDLSQARALLENLGYVVIFQYEKYRTTYECDQVEIMLDELPYGDFVEFEGAPEALKQAARHFGLNWSAAIPDSYHALFERLRIAQDIPFKDLTFSNFAGLAARIGDLHLLPADE